jgi:hypothetical protein
MLKFAFKDASTKNSEPTYWTVLFVMLFFLLLGHYIVCLSVYYCVDRCLSFCLCVSWPLYCLFVYYCVDRCLSFYPFCFLAIILSVCLCIIVSTVVYHVITRGDISENRKRWNFGSRQKQKSKKLKHPIE